MKKFLSLIVLSLLMMTGLAWAQGSEFFTNLPTNNPNNYTSRSWTGTDGVTWTAGGARTDQTLIGKAICFGSTSHGDRWVKSPTYTNGMGTLTFKYVRGFAGALSETRILQVYVNNTQIGSDITVSNTSDVATTYFNRINVSDDVILEIKSIGSAQVIVDEIQWTAQNNPINSPYLSVSSNNLNRFCYTAGVVPSPEQLFAVQGWHLTDNVLITTGENSAFEISLNANGTYSDDLMVSPIDGLIGITPIYVRMKTTLGAGVKTGSITVSSLNAGIKTISLEGEVYNPISMHCYFITFEDAPKHGTYVERTVKLSSIDWKMLGVLIVDEENDWRKGFISTRLRNSADTHMTMDEDKPNGLGTISFFYCRYGSDPQTNISWKVEYSRDKGINWIQVGDVFSATADVKEFRETVNATGDVRVRIRRAGLVGANNDGAKRINIDNILMTRYFDYYTGVAKPIDEIGTVTFTTGYANNSEAAMPPIPNTSIGADEYKSLSLDLVASDTWTVQIETEFDFCSYNRQNQWYDAEKSGGMFTINIPEAAKSTNDLFIVLSNKNPTLPVELSSFLAMINTNGDPVLTWETQTETGVNGFYIYRGVSRDLNGAIMISSLIPATNSSLAHSYSFVDTDIYEDGTYYYWLNVSDLNGHESYHGPAELDYSPLDNGASGEVPYNTGFKSIYPNPFNPSANIAFGLAEAGEVCISVYNVRGQLVRNFAPFTHDAGYGSIVWNGKDDGGNSVSSGLYFFRMKVGTKIYNIKALLLK